MSKSTVNLSDGGKVVDLFIAQSNDGRWAINGTYEGPTKAWKDRIFEVIFFSKLEKAIIMFPTAPVERNFKHIY